MLAEFHFIRPFFLLLIIPIMGLGWFLKKKAIHSPWEKVIEPILLKNILNHHLNSNRWLQRWIWIGVILAVIALSGPTWTQEAAPLYHEMTGRVITLDLSQSMLAQDVKPNRITRARQKIQDILAQIKDDQVALIGYAAYPFVITPLTQDTKTISGQLKALTPEIMPQQGSSVYRAVQGAANLLKQANLENGQILLITDGISESDFRKTQAFMKESPFELAILGVGTSMGAPIPKPGGGFYQQSGKLVMSTLDHDRLQALASHGAYHDLTLNDNDIHFLLENTLKGKITQEDNIQDQQWRDMGPYILLVLLPIGALLFRKGVLFLLIFFVFPFSASEASDLWQRPDQKAYQTMQKGIAAYDEKDYQSAEKYFKEGKDGISQYNLGNALARQGQYKKAIEAYNKALVLKPELKEAAYNRDLLLKMEMDREKNNQNNPSENDSNGKKDKSENQSTDQENRDSKQDSSSAESKSASSHSSENEPTSRQENSDQMRTEQQSAEGELNQDKKIADQLKDNQEGNGKDSHDFSDVSNKASTEETTENAEEMQTIDSVEDKQTENQPDSAFQEETEQDKKENKNKENSVGEEQVLPSSSNTVDIPPALQRIPDDPAGLLRRKFLYQYQQQYANQPERGDPW